MDFQGHQRAFRDKAQSDLLQECDSNLVPIRLQIKQSLDAERGHIIGPYDEVVLKASEQASCRTFRFGPSSFYDLKLL